LAHTLVAIDEPLKESETISYILDGLSTNYDPLVTSITTRVEPISMEDLYGHLLTHEQRIEIHNSALDLSSSSVNVAHCHIFSSNNNTHGSHSSHGTSYAGCGRGHGKGRSHSYNHFSNSNSSNRPVCQICGKLGHLAAKCYNRFYHAFQGGSQVQLLITLPHMWPLIHHGIMIQALLIT
jgi:hypothetical protein